MNWTHLLVHTSDIQRKVISARIVSNPRFPLSAPTKWMNGWPTLVNVFFGFKRETKGEYKAFCIGGVLSKEKTLEWKLRMKVDFHHKFVVNEQMESTTKSTHLFFYQGTFHSLKPTNQLKYTVNFVSALHFNYRTIAKEIRQNRHWQVPLYFISRLSIVV